MVYVAACACVVLFILAFEKLGVVPVASRAVATGRGAMAVLSADDLSEEQKEKQVQQAALHMMRAFASLTLRGVLTLVVAALPAVVGQALGWVTLDATLMFLASWPAIIGASVVMTVVYFARRKAA